jgi:hypothetical protein
MRKRLLGLLVLVGVLVFGPFITGVWFKHDYNKLIAFYNSQGSLHIELVDYQRHWMSSDAILQVEVTDPDFRQLLIALGVNRADFPPHFTFTLNQHIQHGPVIYHHVANFSSRFALAAIHNAVQWSPDVADFLQAYGVTGSSLKVDDDVVTFLERKHIFISKMCKAMYGFRRARFVL